MKVVSKFKIVVLVVFTGLIFSCKNNNDGYSDEIVTSSTPIDSTTTAKDTTSDSPANNTAAGANVAPSDGPGENSATSSAGTGSGPGESSQDGATYTTATGVQKDSVRPEAKKSSGAKKK